MIKEWLGKMSSIRVSNLEPYITPDDVEPIRTGKEIINSSDDYKSILQSLKRELPLNDNYIEQFYFAPIYKLAEFVQMMPASEGDHHSHKGGLIRHTLEVCLYAVRGSRGRIFMPNDENEIAKLRDVFTYICFLAALFHDSGKVISDLKVIYRLKPNDSFKVWNPLIGPMPYGAQYKYIFNDKRNYKLHSNCPLVLLHQCLNDDQKNWIFKEYSLFSELIFCLSGNSDLSSHVNDIVKKADIWSVRLSRQADPIVKANSNLETNPSKSKKLDNLFLEIGDFLRKSETLNHTNNPFFVMQDHIILIHPRWSDALVDKTKDRTSEQNRLLNMLGESDDVIKSGVKTLNKLMISQTSTKYGNISETPVNVVIINRNAVDPRFELDVGELSIKGTGITPLPDLINHYMKKNENIDNTQSTVPAYSNKTPEVRETDTKQNSPKVKNTTSVRAPSDDSAKSYHSNDGHLNESNKHDDNDGSQGSAHDCEMQIFTHDNDRSVSSQQERQISHDFDKINSVKGQNKTSSNNTTENMLLTSNFPNSSIVRGASSADNEADRKIKILELSPIQKEFKIFIASVTREKKMVNKPQALIHKTSDGIVMVWPKAANLFAIRRRVPLEEILKDPQNLKEVVRNELLKAGIHDVQPGNINFINIAFKARFDAVPGDPISAIKLAPFFVAQIHELSNFPVSEKCVVVC